MGEHVAGWTLEQGWAEALAYAWAPRFRAGDTNWGGEPGWLNERLTRGRHVATHPTGTAVGFLRNSAAWEKEKP